MLRAILHKHRHHVTFGNAYAAEIARNSTGIFLQFGKRPLSSIIHANYCSFAGVFACHFAENVEEVEFFVLVIF